MFRELRNKVYGAKIDGFMGKARGKVYSKSKESEKSLQKLYIERYDSLKRQGFSRDYIISTIGLSPAEKEMKKEKEAVKNVKIDTKNLENSKNKEVKQHKDSLKETNETIEKSQIILRQLKESERVKEARKTAKLAEEKELERYKKLAEEKAAKLAEAEFDSIHRIEARKAAAEEKAKEARKTAKLAEEKELERYKKLAEEKAAKLAEEKKFDSTTVDVDNLGEKENKKIDNFCNMLYRRLEKFYGIEEEERWDLITDFVAKKLSNVLKAKTYKERKKIVLEFITEVISSYELKTKEELLKDVDDTSLVISYCEALQRNGYAANDYRLDDYLNDVVKGKEILVK